MGNDNVIYQGPQEIIDNASPAALTKNALVINALTDLVITNLVFMFPANPPAANVVNALTLKQGGFLFHVASATFSGTAAVTYYNSRSGSNGGN